jgi:hypothetical protein
MAQLWPTGGRPLGRQVAPSARIPHELLRRARASRAPWRGRGHGRRWQPPATHRGLRGGATFVFGGVPFRGLRQTLNSRPHFSQVIGPGGPAAPPPPGGESATGTCATSPPTRRRHFRLRAPVRRGVISNATFPAERATATFVMERGLLPPPGSMRGRVVSDWGIEAVRPGGPPWS